MVFIINLGVRFICTARVYDLLCRVSFLGHGVDFDIYPSGNPSSVYLQFLGEYRTMIL